MQEGFSGVQELQEFRSSDNSSDYEEQVDTEGSVNVSRRGGVCPPEQTTHNHSSGQADPAPTEGENKESASSAQSAPKKISQ